MKFPTQSLLNIIHFDHQQLKSVENFFNFLLCHSCWCSFAIGAILLVIGIVLILNLIHSIHYNLIIGTGIFFIALASILMMISPLIMLIEFAGQQKKLSSSSPQSTNETMQSTDNNNQRRNVRRSFSFRNQSLNHQQATISTSPSGVRQSYLNTNNHNDEDDLPNYADLHKHGTIPIRYINNNNDDDNNQRMEQQSSNTTTDNQSQSQPPPTYNEIISRQQQQQQQTIDTIATIEPSQIINMMII